MQPARIMPDSVPAGSRSVAENPRRELWRGTISTYYCTSLKILEAGVGIELAYTPLQGENAFKQNNDLQRDSR